MSQFDTVATVQDELESMEFLENEREELMQQWINSMVCPLWSMSVIEHRKLWKLVCDDFHQYVDCKLIELQKEHEQITIKVKSLDNNISLYLMNSAKIIAMTTTGAAINQQLLANIPSKIIMIEEAGTTDSCNIVRRYIIIVTYRNVSAASMCVGEVLESHVVAAISQHTQQIIMIGDHLQLRPSINQHHLTCEAKQNVDFDRSLFERLVDMYDRCSNNSSNASPPQLGAVVTLCAAI